VATGTFYGVEQGTWASDIIASFLISFFGTAPSFVAKKLFMNSKPKIVKSSKHDFEALQQALQQKAKKNPAMLQRQAHITADSSFVTESDDFSDFIGEIKGFVTQRKGKVDVKEFQTHVATLYDDSDEAQKLLAVSNIRQFVYDSMFPLPYACRAVTWTLIVVWSAAACIMAIVYGLQFDTLYAAQGLNEDNPNYELYKSDCWNTSLQLQMESAATEQDFVRLNDEQAAANASSYAGGDSASWLLSILQSLLTSLLVWQPLMVYNVTWLKIWAFSWHLKLSIGPGNLIQLFKRCCCRNSDDDDDDDELQVRPDFGSGLSPMSPDAFNSAQTSHDRARTTQRIKNVIAHKDRPMDIISFLGNDEWIINDMDNKEGADGAITLVVDQGQKKGSNAEDASDELVQQHPMNGTPPDSLPSDEITSTADQAVVAMDADDDTQDGDGFVIIADAEEEEDLYATVNANDQDINGDNGGTQSQLEESIDIDRSTDAEKSGHAGQISVELVVADHESARL